MLRTGWTDPELLAAPPAKVAMMRHALYAEAHTSAVNLDVDRELRDLTDSEITDPKARERLHRKRVGEARERLQGFRKVQAVVRTLLHLDDPEPIPEAAE